jgi:hypothetical protein
MGIGVFGDWLGYSRCADAVVEEVMETWEEQKAWLKAMADDDGESWDLSDVDGRAIRAALARIEELERNLIEEQADAMRKNEVLAAERIAELERSLSLVLKGEGIETFIGKIEEMEELNAKARG